MGALDHALGFAGISTFGKYPYSKDIEGADIVVMGVPYDAGVTNRSGTKLGPRAIRLMSALAFDFNYLWNTEDFTLNEACKKIIDYGDVGMGYGPKATEIMLEETYKEAKKIYDAGAKLMTLGGDHTIPYGMVRAAKEKYGTLSLIHFDSHGDTQKSYGDISHGNFAWDLQEEGCIDPSKSVQACIRTNMPLCGYNIIYANELLYMNPKEFAEKIKSIVGDNPVYVTFDIDALDPAYAPGTGTPVCGGPDTNYILNTLRELEGIHIVAADVVEVAPQYDHGEITALAAAHVAQSLMCLMAKDRIKA